MDWLLPSSQPSCAASHRATTLYDDAALLLQLTITARVDAESTDSVLPVSYPNFTSMVQKGDTIFVGRYLVTGSEDSSLYLTVSFWVF